MGLALPKSKSAAKRQKLSDNDLQRRAEPGEEPEPEEQEETTSGGPSSSSNPMVFKLDSERIHAAKIFRSEQKQESDSDSIQGGTEEGYRVPIFGNISVSHPEGTSLMDSSE